MAARGSSREFIQRNDGTFGGSRPGVQARDVSLLRVNVLDDVDTDRDDPDFPRDAWEADRELGLTDLGYDTWLAAQWAQVDEDMTAIARLAELDDIRHGDDHGF